MIEAYKKKMRGAVIVCAAAYALVGVILALVTPEQSGFAMLIVSLLMVIGGVAFIAILWFYIKSKGRSGWWILMLVFSILGLIFLLVLEDRSANIETKNA